MPGVGGQGDGMAGNYLGDGGAQHDLLSPAGRSSEDTETVPDRGAAAGHPDSRKASFFQVFGDC